MGAKIDQRAFSFVQNHEPMAGQELAHMPTAKKKTSAAPVTVTPPATPPAPAPVAAVVEAVEEVAEAVESNAADALAGITKQLGELHQLAFPPKPTDAPATAPAKKSSGAAVLIVGLLILAAPILLVLGLVFRNRVTNKE